MPHYKYLLVGGGMTASAAVGGIREVDAKGSIGLIGAEQDPPYLRPALSKGLWKGESPEKIWLGAQEKGVEFHLGRTALRLNPADHTLEDDRGTLYTFEKLLLATGGTPRRLPNGAEDVIYFRSLADYRHLRELTQAGNRFAVIGGGFIGWEIASALAMNGQQVTMLFPEGAIGQRLYPPDLARFLNRFYAEQGVEVLAQTQVVGVSRQARGLSVSLRTASEEPARDLRVDGVVAGIGILPNTTLAEAAGLAVAGGIVVDERLRTSHPDIYAAGDVASFPSPSLGRRLRLEHEDNANATGRLAGRGMAGVEEVYDYLPFFYSDLFDLGYEAVGQVDSQLQTVAEWKEPFREGVVGYLEEGRLRGVLLWNVWGQVEAARELIRLPVPRSEAALREELRAELLA